MILPSLFIVSLPRSLSSRVFQYARLALGLKEPGWVSDGEILNPDRHLLSEDRTSSSHYLPADGADPRVARIDQILRNTIEPSGFAYKDVTQPLHVANYLQQHGGALRILRIDRSIPDVAMAMIARGWTYPSRLSEPDLEPTSALVSGLLAAKRALELVPGHAIDFDDLTTERDALRRALQLLYPGRALRRTVGGRRVRPPAERGVGQAPKARVCAAQHARGGAISAPEAGGRELCVGGIQGAARAGRR